MFSIITVSYNNAKGLALTIDSVRQQSIDKKDYEYIVIEGNSGDGSAEVIDANNSFIDHACIENDMGIFDAMNKGIARATKKYIYFLNSGDVFESDSVLEKMREIIISYPEKLLYNGIVHNYSNGVFLGKAELAPWVCHQATFLDTSIAKNYRFDDTFKVFGDLDLWYRLKKDGKFNPFNIDLVICSMELDGVGTSPKYIGKKITDKFKFNLKHRLWLRVLLDSVLITGRYLFFSLLGRDLYHKYMSSLFLRVSMAVKHFLKFIRL